MVHVIPKRKCFHLVRLVDSLSNLLKKVKKKTKTKPYKPTKTNPGWFYQTRHPTGQRLQNIFSFSQSEDLLRRFAICLHQDKNKSGQCTKMCYDPKQSLYTAVFLNLANLQDFSLFRPTCCTSPSCLMTCPPVLNESIVFMGPQNVLETPHSQIQQKL